MVSAGSGLQIASLTVEIDGLKAFVLLPQAPILLPQAPFVSSAF